MTTQTEIIQRNRRRAVQFFWAFLISATAVSLAGNIAHAVLPYIPRLVVQIGAAAVPPIALLAAVHGIALAVRAGASGKVYCWAVGAVAAIGVGAFALSFLAVTDLMQAIGYSPTTAWVFPAIIDTTVAVSTLMLVALGDKPARRSRAVATSASAEVHSVHNLAQASVRSAKAQLKRFAQTEARSQKPVSARPNSAQKMQSSTQADATHVDADLALELIASGVTTQPVEIVIAVIVASGNGASINAAARAAGINHRTAQRVVKAAREHRQGQLAVVS
jgi:hypothetical protein